jgi:hypothetical protein
MSLFQHSVEESTFCVIKVRIQLSAEHVAPSPPHMLQPEVRTRGNIKQLKHLLMLETLQVAQKSTV